MPWFNALWQAVVNSMTEFWRSGATSFYGDYLDSDGEWKENMFHKAAGRKILGQLEAVKPHLRVLQIVWCLRPSSRIGAW